MNSTPRTDAIESFETYEEWEVTNNYKSLCEDLELEVSKLKSAIREADECSTSYEGVGLLYWMDGCQFGDEDPSWITISDTLHNPL